jgi:hypothetical protein
LIVFGYSDSHTGNEAIDNRAHSRIVDDSALLGMLSRAL